MHARVPAGHPIEEKAVVVSGSGLDTVGHFTLPPAAWRDHYYAPIKVRLEILRRTWSGDVVGLGVITEIDAEIAMYERWGHTHGYEFFVARRPTR